MPPGEKDISYWMGQVDASVKTLTEQVGNQGESQIKMRDELRDWRADTDLRLSQGSSRFRAIEKRIDYHVQKGSQNHQEDNPKKENVVTFKYLWHNFSRPVIVAVVVWLLLEGLPNILTYAH